MIFIFLLALLFGASPVQAQDSEVIREFRSQITINQDTSLTTKETIDFYTPVAKHGIYRYIPYRYNRENLSYSTKHRLQSITDQTGAEVQYEKSYSSGNVTFKIGDPDATFTGVKTYQIAYTSEDILQRYEGYDELYLDITGEGWQIPIARTTAVISSPFAQIKEVACYSGEFGSTNSECGIVSQTSDQVEIAYNQTIAYGENLTIAIKLNPDNQLKFPTPTEKFIKTLIDNIGSLLLLTPLIWMAVIWFYRGRDRVFYSANIFDTDANKPSHLRPLFGRFRMPISYMPIKDLTPGQAGTILDERVDNQDIVAEIIDLARKKYLKIEPLKTKKLIFSTKDFHFVQLKQADKSLPAHQKYLHEQIFKTGTQVKLSKLKGKFHTTMAKVKTMIMDSIVEKGFFTTNPTKLRVYYSLIFAGILALLIFVAAISGAFISPWPFFLIGLNGGAFVLFLITIPQKSALGTNYYFQTKGLKETIRRGSWRQKINEKNIYIEEILPFAISFGVVKQLSKDMEDLSIKAPDYAQSFAAGNMSTYHFVNAFTTQATSSLSYNPSSNSTSGGSGFSGGSSGGGFSGGGGGSW